MCLLVAVGERERERERLTYNNNNNNNNLRAIFNLRPTNANNAVNNNYHLLPPFYPV